jgi:hypothetical protein
MKRLKYLVILLCSFGAIALNSCLSNSVTNYSDDARVYSFALKSDSVPAFAKRTFTVDQTGGGAYKTNGIIYNEDSLPFKTKLYKQYKAIPVIRTYSSAAMFFNDTVYASGDSIDFRWKHVLKNYAENGTDTMSYFVDVRVHKVEPDSIAWQRRVYPASFAETDQKAVYCNDLIMLFLNNGSNISMYSTTDAKSWSNGTTVSSLPASVFMQNMVVLNDTAIYVANNGNLYKSDAKSKGTSWYQIAYTSQHQIKTLISAYDHKLFAITKDNSNNYFVESSADGKNWTVQNAVTSIESNNSNGKAANSEFPISNFAATVITPETGTPKLLMVGGVDKDGNTLNSVYSYSASSNSWANYATEFTTDTTLRPQKNGAMIWYDNQAMYYCGALANGNLVPDTLLCSKTSGFSWTKNDTLVNFPKVLNYKLRSKASIIVDKSNRIFLIGGKDANGNFLKEAWVGRKNRLGFGLSPM